MYSRLGKKLSIEIPRCRFGRYSTVRLDASIAGWILDIQEQTRIAAERCSSLFVSQPVAQNATDHDLGSKEYCLTI